MVAYDNGPVPNTHAGYARSAIISNGNQITFATESLFNAGRTYQQKSISILDNSSSFTTFVLSYSDYQGNGTGTGRIGMAIIGEIR